ncbi:DUF3992 domain-containing protein [Paenibacillus sp. OV219]|uniref:DUF3992 domain-containing protein n=1 Tax=Paenibacillus sp. OV219 TaxID=1884377 RepID=UPI0008CC041C|nr:S-Ena type endospore appendage [Paenibacillus sp. OV219]SEM80250.1 Protein of unknown function [Paenibacillus sp. OV219]
MCDSSSALSCCSESIAVQDKVCINWQFAAAGTQIIYSDNLAQIIKGTGYVKIVTGTVGVTINFLLTGVVIPVQTIIVPPNGSTTFTVSRFNTINLVATGAVQGEFCITVRYTI